MAGIPSKPTGEPGGEQPLTKTSTDPTRRNILGFALLAGGVTATAGYLLWPTVRDSGLFGESAGQVVAISMSGFSPSNLTARAGQEVKLQLVNKDNSLHTDGGGWHQFAIDDLGVDFKVPPLTVSDVSFTPDKPGTYDFYCGVCCGGKANPYMHGQLVVEA